MDVQASISGKKYEFLFHHHFRMESEDTILLNVQKEFLFSVNRPKREVDQSQLVKGKSSPFIGYYGP